MKNFYKSLFGLSLFISSSCVSNRTNKAVNQDRFTIIIEDYISHNKSYIKKYNMFSIIDETPLNKNYYFYKLLPILSGNAYVMSSEHPYLPSDYIEYKGKVFFIEENDKIVPDQKVLDYLNSLDMLDSTDVKIELGLIDPENAVYRKYGTDDSLEGVDYIFCKDKPLQIKKKIKSSTYISPDDERFNDICN